MVLSAAHSPSFNDPSFFFLNMDPVFKQSQSLLPAFYFLFYEIHFKRASYIKVIQSTKPVFHSPR